MKIINRSGSVIFEGGTRPMTFVVPQDFGQMLISGGVKYTSYEDRLTDWGIVYVMVTKTLDMTVPDFEDLFIGIADSDVGKAVFRGDLPVDTVL